MNCRGIANWLIIGVFVFAVVLVLVGVTNNPLRTSIRNSVFGVDKSVGFSESNPAEALSFVRQSSSLSCDVVGGVYLHESSCPLFSSVQCFDLTDGSGNFDGDVHLGGLETKFISDGDWGVVHAWDVGVVDRCIVTQRCDGVISYNLPKVFGVVNVSGSVVDLRSDRYLGFSATPLCGVSVALPSISIPSVRVGGKYFYPVSYVNSQGSKCEGSLRLYYIRSGVDLLNARMDAGLLNMSSVNKPYPLCWN